MAFSQVALVSLVLVLWLHFTDRLTLAKEVFDSTGQGIIVTDANGVIVSVNPAFTELTGYDDSDALGKTPNILRSDKQEEKSYEEMCSSIQTTVHCEGEIWNKKKKGDVYVQLLMIN